MKAKAGRSVSAIRHRFAMVAVALLSVVGIGVPAAVLVPASTAGATSTWSAPIHINGTRTTTDIACPSTTLCWAVGRTGYVVEWNGTSWATPASTSDTTTLNAVACPSTSLCWAVGLTGYAMEWNGTSWGTKIDIDGTSRLYNISCPSTTLCWATDWSGNAFEWNGTSWGAAVALGNSTVHPIACPSISLCWAVGLNGKGAEWNGTSWGAEITILPLTGTKKLGGISCPSTTLCWAVSSTGQAVEWNGTSWGAATTVVPGATIMSISCPSTTLCWAGTYTSVAEWNGTSWGSTTTLTATYINSITCPSTTLCWSAAAGVTFAAGYAVEWTTASTPGTPATANIASGALVFASAPASLAWSYTSTGRNAANLPMVGTTEALDVQDARGTGAGWRMDLTSTTFATPSPVHQLATTAASVQTAPATPTCDAGDVGGCAVASNNVTYPYQVPAGTTAPTAAAVVSAATTTGMGDQTVNVPFVLSLPASVYAGTYTSTWTFTLVSGP